MRGRTTAKASDACYEAPDASANDHRQITYVPAAATRRSYIVASSHGIVTGGITLAVNQAQSQHRDPAEGDAREHDYVEDHLGNSVHAIPAAIENRVVKHIRFFP